MKRTYYAILLLLIPVVLFGALLIKETQVPPAVLKEVEQYLIFTSGGFTEHPSISRISRAQRPWKFKAEMSDRSYGDSVHYFTDEPYGAVHPDLSPLLYLPDDIWCVFMQKTDRVPQIIYVAAHEDLYNADWIVHEPAHQYKGDIETIGCGAN